MFDPKGRETAQKTNALAVTSPQSPRFWLYPSPIASDYPLESSHMRVARFTAVGVGLALLFGAPRASGEPSPERAPKPRAARAAPGCRVQGPAEPRANAPIEDAQGRLVARFSGAATELVAEGFPAEPTGRVRVTTGTGTGSFRVQGFTPVRELSLYSASPIPVAPGHVWIAAGKSLSFLGSGRGALHVEKRVTAPFAQSFRAWAPCGSVSLARPAAAPITAMGDARGYVVRRPRLDLLGDPRRPQARLLTLLSSPQAPPALFFGREQRGDWLRVEHRGEMIIDAWVRAGDLEALPQGETLDQLGTDAGSKVSADLAVQGEPRIVKASREVPFRARALDGEPPIGVIEPEAEVYVLDVVAGWVSVVPKSLQVVPRPDGQFWVRAEELGM